jgi:limonene-1,2-epoxide hydrolase
MCAPENIDRRAYRFSIAVGALDGKGCVSAYNCTIGSLIGSAENIALIRRFLEACVRADPEEFAAWFTEDATWWNAPWKPVHGRDAIRETLRRGAERMVALPWEIRNIVAGGDVVMVERVDHFLVGERRVSVPSMGIFELRGGKIAAWRDYWDLQQFESQLSP